MYEYIIISNLVNVHLIYVYLKIKFLNSGRPLQQPEIPFHNYNRVADPQTETEPQKGQNLDTWF
jgi:hypothetical protein